VKVHRARVMKKMRVRTLADLVLTALLAGVADRPRTRPPNPS
jgi:FixJ family two-component response regulator